LKKKYIDREVKYVKNIKNLNKKQAEYRKAINEFPVVFGIGPAGTGKTFLSVVEATKAFDINQIERIVIVRPAVATESLGYLPGTFEEKLDPYLRPIFDALCDRWGPKTVKYRLDSMEIEIIALAYIRGRTLNNCFIIGDEFQNATIDQMKAFLTRIGDNTNCVITGDLSQSDLDQENGLKWACSKLKNCDIVNIIEFERDHVVRSDVVKELLKYI